jgi:hypothetical protein
MRYYVAHQLKVLGWSPQPPAVYARERNVDLVWA